MKEAVRIVKNRFRYGVAVTVSVEEYDSHALDMKGFKTAYSFLCHMAMSATAQIVKKHGDSGPITYVFEDGRAYAGDARYMVGKIGLIPELKAAYLHNGDAFLAKTDAVPLQAADLLAWEASKFQRETIDENKRDIRLSLLDLFAADPGRYSIGFCKGAPLTKALRSYQNEFALELKEEERAWNRHERNRQSLRASERASRKSLPQSLN